MSTRKLIARSLGIAALASGGFVALQSFGPLPPAFRAQSAPVVLTGASLSPSPVFATAHDATNIGGPIDAVETPEVATLGLLHGQVPPHAVQPVTQPADSVALSPFGLPCGLSLTAEAMPGALVALDIMEPCAPDARVTITHGPLVFAAQTDAMGLLTLDIPALETPAFFTVRLEDGTEATTLAGLPDLIDYDRAAIVWDEDRSLQLHAYENGADFGAPGHVWQETPGRITDALIGTGGFLITLGDSTLDDPQLAQIYTSAQTLRDDVRLSVEVPVTDANCGRPVRARSLQIGEGGQINDRPVTMILPGCDAVGEFLLLQNLFLDLRLASN